MVVDIGDKEGVHVCYGKLLLQVPLCLLLSQLSLIIVTTQTQLLRTADMRGGVRVTRSHTCNDDNSSYWAEVSHSYTGHHPIPLPRQARTSQADNLLTATGRALLHQAAPSRDLLTRF